MARQTRGGVGMKLLGPERYSLSWDHLESDRCSVRCGKGTPRFSGIATQAVPKLYVVSRDKWPVYVGRTSQRMSARLRYGFKARGEKGYHGYSWRKLFMDAVIDVWCPISISGPLSSQDVETIEAEVVFLIRQNGQWPLYQTEIHFHASTADHRRLAAEVFRHYASDSSKG